MTKDLNEETMRVFPEEFRTKVFINSVNCISIMQMDGEDKSIIVIQSKKRAIEIARAIRHLAGLADFRVDEEAE